MDEKYLAVLARRFGQTAVREWYDQAELVARMAFDSMVAISGAAGKPAAPESLAIVMRYQAPAEPEGICAVAAVCPTGPMETAAKRTLLARAVTCLDTTGDVLFVETRQRPAERLIVLPPDVKIPDLHEVVVPPAAAPLPAPEVPTPPADPVVAAPTYEASTSDLLLPAPVDGAGG